MIVPYESEAYDHNDACTILAAASAANESTCANMEAATSTMCTTQCVYCGQMLLQTAGCAEPLVCEPCWMTTFAAEPVTLENLVCLSEDFDDSCQGSINGDAAASSACDDDQYEPEPEVGGEYTASACVDSLVTVREAAELYRYDWLANCFMCATTDVYEWQRVPEEIWVGIDVCPYYLEDVPAQVLLGKKYLDQRTPLVLKQLARLAKCIFLRWYLWLRRRSRSTIRWACMSSTSQNGNVIMWNR